MPANNTESGFDRSRRVVFDTLPELYDRARPSYPPDLIQDVIRISNIPDRGRILEIGCGPGKATLPFARLGFQITCVELGPSLVKIARKNLSSFDHVEVINSAFEDFTPDPGSYDLVLSAQAFHWIHPDDGYPKCHKSLRNEGTLALFWNRAPEKEQPIFSKIDQVYKRLAPHIASDDKFRSLHHWEALVRSEIESSQLFMKTQVLHYPWECRYSEQSYLELLDTFSDHAQLPSETKGKLFGAIGAIIRGNGGEIIKKYVAVLFISRKV